jgi:hypothetical protein
VAGNYSLANEKLLAAVMTQRDDVVKTIQEENTKIEEGKKKVSAYKKENNVFSDLLAKCGDVISLLYSPYGILAGILIFAVVIYIGLKCARCGVCGPFIAVSIPCTCV